MITIMIVGAIIAWLLIGTLTVIAAAKLEICDDLVNGDGNLVCTLVFWPIAIITMLLISLGRLGRVIGEWL